MRCLNSSIWLFVKGGEARRISEEMEGQEKGTAKKKGSQNVWSNRKLWTDGAVCGKRRSSWGGASERLQFFGWRSKSAQGSQASLDVCGDVRLERYRVILSRPWTKRWVRMGEVRSQTSLRFFEERERGLFYLKNSLLGRVLWFIFFNSYPNPSGNNVHTYPKTPASAKRWSDRW